MNELDYRIKWGMFYRERKPWRPLYIQFKRGINPFGSFGLVILRHNLPIAIESRKRWAVSSIYRRVKRELDRVALEMGRGR